ncbi:MAG: hypothetical protein NZ899_05630 [Thermoguttaceae bacterium]|nr:hypothetical protein [Thermoguttaceae bacterium]MDW8079421.1 hypothetical protein [Thermoguttaceae bacterium]
MMWLKKVPWWVAASVAAVVVSSLGVATTWSYIKTAFRGFGEAIREATPIGFELERLNTELRDLEPEIRRNQRVLAQLEIEEENLAQEVAQLEASQKQLMAQMRNIRAALGGDAPQVQFAGQSYRRSDLERKLAAQMDEFDAREVELQLKRKLLAERQKHREMAQAKVSEYRRQYEQLRIKAESLAAQLKALEAAEAAGSVSFDTSRLARAKDLAREIESRIRVGLRVLDADRIGDQGIPVEADTRSVIERFDERYGRPEGQAAEGGNEI